MHLTLPPSTKRRIVQYRRDSSSDKRGRCQNRRKAVPKVGVFASKRPEAENFAREKAYKLTGPITIVAEATHNTHGREGSKTWTVTLAPEENEARARLTNPSAGPW